MKENKNKVIITLLIIVSMITIFFAFKTFKNKPLKELPEVKLKEITNSSFFAIMVQNDDTYKEYDNDTWPGSNYVYKEAKCTDNNGALIDDAVTFADGKATLTTNKTVFCTLYFDEKPDPAKDLRSKDPNGNLSSDLQGGMYRYQGTDNVPNWICFGTRDSNTCKNDEGIDKYMYRIIGITEEGQMYLLKETFLKEESVTGFVWDDVYNISGSDGDSCENGKCPEWNTADLFQRINGTANGTRMGAGNFNDKKDDNSDIFVDSSEYDYLKSGDGINGTSSASEWYNLIADHEWMYGDTTQTYYNGKNMYDIETGQTETTHYVQNPEGSTTVEQQTYTWSQKVKAKISLMYMHDVAYAYYDGTQDNTRGNPESSTNVKNSWIHFQKDGYNTSPAYEWLSTRWTVLGVGLTTFYAWYVFDDGALHGRYLFGDSGVRPVFYLESKAKIASGDGTKNSPFIFA